MKEKTLLNIALFTTIVGLLILFLISGSIEIDETAIDKITLQNVDQTVKIKGKITNLIDTEKVVIASIEQPTETTTILFKPDENPTNLQEGMEVEILGKIAEYEGQPEVIAHRVRIIS